MDKGHGTCVKKHVDYQKEDENNNLSKYIVRINYNEKEVVFCGTYFEIQKPTSSLT